MLQVMCVTGSIVLAFFTFVIFLNQYGEMLRVANSYLEVEPDSIKPLAAGKNCVLQADIFLGLADG